MAVIPVSPTTDLSALIASDNVSPGDVLVLEDGEYFQTVDVTKDNLRLVAKGNKAVFNGKSILEVAFILNGVTGVEVSGISIMHYRLNGIRIQEGGGHRIVANKINRILDTGFAVISSGENLLWKNEICRTFIGVQLSFGSVNNRILENLAALCILDGFEIFSQNDSGNVFIGNTAINNGGFGMHCAGTNHLLVDNRLAGNAFGGLGFEPGSNSIAIGNVLEDNRNRGGFLFAQESLFFGGNNVKANLRDGIAVIGINNGIFQDNIFKFNKDYGITLHPTTEANFVFDNKLRCNLPANIRDLSGGNNYLDNREEPCKPHELEAEDCRICLKHFLDSIAGERPKQGHQYWVSVAGDTGGEYSATDR
ncbi:MAG: right-handed parallel beta-helix repeat-containing protein [Clostridia bacterium]|nr:right-handed parallel beta-helix repeat-containing protein [Clostridia bacterium]